MSRYAARIERGTSGDSIKDAEHYPWCLPQPKVAILEPPGEARCVRVSGVYICVIIHLDHTLNMLFVLFVPENLPSFHILRTPSKGLSYARIKRLC